MDSVAGAERGAARDRAQLAGLHVGLLLLYAGLAFFYYRHVALVADRVSVPPGGDFINIWTAAKLALAGQAGILYDPAAWHEAQKALFGDAVEFHNYGYPPFFLPFIIGFGLLPYKAAWAAWCAGTFALFAVSVRRLTGAGRGVLLLLALAPASYVNVLTGQNGFLSAALFTGGLALLPNRPVAAGAAFGLLVYKPHLGILIPPALAARGAWTAFGVAAAAVLALFAAGALLYGPAMTVTYLTQVAQAQARVMTRGEGVFLMMMPSAFAALRLLGAPAAAGYALSALLMFCGAAATLFAWRRCADAGLRAAVLLCAAQLCVPYLLCYDMTLGSVAAILLFPHVRGRGERAVLLALWFAPLLTIFMNFAGLPAGPLILAAALVLSLRCAARYSATE